LIMTLLFDFAPAHVSQRNLIHTWLQQDYIKAWIHGVGLQSTLNGLEKFFAGVSSTTYWIGYHQKQPCAFLITSPEGAHASTLDVFICEPNYVGKGYAVTMIRQFLCENFAHLEKILIDPEISNTRAVHVYKKVGFKIVGEFLADWHPVPHYHMELAMQDLLKN